MSGNKTERISDKTERISEKTLYRACIQDNYEVVSEICRKLPHPKHIGSLIHISKQQFNSLRALVDHRIFCLDVYSGIGNYLYMTKAARTRAIKKKFAKLDNSLLELSKNELSREKILSLAKLLVSLNVLRSFIFHKMRIFCGHSEMDHHYINHPYRCLFLAYGLIDPNVPYYNHKKLLTCLNLKYYCDKGDKNTSLNDSNSSMGWSLRLQTNKPQRLEDRLVNYYILAFKENAYYCRTVYKITCAIHLLGIVQSSELANIRFRFHD